MKKLGEGSTPGPWHTGIRTAHQKRDVYGPHGESVAVTDDVCNTTEEAQANARLIAKAPLLIPAQHLIKDMLDELIAWRHYYHSHKEGPETNLDQTGTCIAAHALLDKLES